MTGTVVGLDVSVATVEPVDDGDDVGAEENAPPASPSNGLLVHNAVGKGTWRTAGLGVSPFLILPVVEGAAVGAADTFPPSVPPVELLVGTAVAGIALGTAVARDAYSLLVKLVEDGVDVGANEASEDGVAVNPDKKASPPSPTVGNNVGSGTSTAVGLAVFLFLLLFIAEGVDVGAEVNVPPLVPPTGLLVGCAVEATICTAVGVCVSP